MVNYLAILISGIVSMIIGGLWFGPLFGKKWMRLMNIPQKQMQEMKKKGMGKSYFWGFIMTLIMSVVLSLFISYFGATTFEQGCWLGFLVWMGFFVTSKLGMVLWENKPFSLYLIHILHDLLALLIVGGILAVWA